ncbi:sensor histidine kinase [Streptomyces sp. 15-116A]|uniref:sensor histidine kinase n=1 Tax=Streptomyces sp. 15-116A TaxID=2259035 RepID=UPI0021B1C43F|nr:sensor histidine kinase [Streptomyces sp. 15-116A]MCT7351092.1 sensor histidine kinase [Streptomyces sp. 15-116A]
MADVAGVEQRWAAVRRWGPYAMLGVGTVLAAATMDIIGMSTAERYATAVLVPAVLLWELWWGRRPERNRAVPSPVSACYYLVRAAAAFALSWLNPFFAFLAAVGYFDADRLLPPRLLKAGLLLSAVTIAGSQSGGLPPSGPLGWGVFGALLGVHLGLITVFGHLTARENQRTLTQTATIAELERTNTALQQALDENAALHAQLLVQAREAGVADERRRLAAEIHDTLAQGLTGIIAQLQVVANTPDPALARQHVERATALARHSLGEARRSVHNLAPVALADEALPQALEKTVTEWAERTGVHAQFTVTGTVEPLHDEVAATLLRIVQEALSNTARHAGAARTGVTLSYMGDEVTLDIRDDGRGFDPLAARIRTGSGGFGLDGMRARAERIAGSLTVESEPGQGTAVSARVPLVRHDR